MPLTSGLLTGFEWLEHMNGFRRQNTMMTNVTEALAEGDIERSNFNFRITCQKNIALIEAICLSMPTALILSYIEPMPFQII